MKKIILIYGIIAGVLVSTFMLLGMTCLSHCDGNVDYNTSMLIGYASMLIAFSIVFVGIRNYRDKYNGGVISFGKAFKVGILMVLIASTIYVIAWLIDYFFFFTDFMDKYSKHAMDDLRASGASQAAIDSQTKQLASMGKMLNNPFINAMMSYVEI